MTDLIEKVARAVYDAMPTAVATKDSNGTIVEAYITPFDIETMSPIVKIAIEVVLREMWVWGHDHAHDWDFHAVEAFARENNIDLEKP